MNTPSADILIIGGGMAGLTAALYALRAGKSALILEKETFGGQITSSPRVDNFPGIPAVSGNQLTDALLSQALDLGAEIELEEIVSLRKENDLFIADTGKKQFTGKAVIIASGAKHRPLGVEREDQLVGHGISYCALCDGAFHKGQDVAVIGGGNSASQAAVFLSDLCKSVTVIQLFDHFTCDQKELDAMQARSNIRLLPSRKVTALLGDSHLTGLELTHPETGEKSSLPMDGLFVCIGRMADNEPFRDLITLNEQGFIVAGEDCRTNVPGIFVAGDCRVKTVRQLTTAAADGSVAAVAACSYVDQM
ncbi:MAG: FAD-dependent oxidoreductase [Clostridia bacterium]|nr:FAD-dependent oxidoreductase [Clostridia bacterium]